MSKNFLYRLTSHEVARILAYKHDELLSVIVDVLRAGHIGATRLTVRGGQPVAASLDLGDLLIVATEMGLSADVAAKLLAAWRHHAGPISHGVGGKAAVHPVPGVLPIVFGKPNLLASVKAAVSGEADPANTGRQYGFRVDAGMMLVATAHPFMSRMLKAHRITPQEMNGAIRALAHGESGRIRRMAGKGYRTAACCADDFLRAAEGKQANT